MNCAYPPKHVIQVYPDTDADHKGKLDISLKLIGTDDNRMFTLTNPQISTETSTAAATALSPTHQEPLKR